MTTPINLPECYAAIRNSLLDLAASMSPEQAETVVPACPEWSVRNVFAHLAGTTADVLAGRLEGVTTDPWTQRQVDERSDLTLFEITNEWATNAPAFDDLLTALGDSMDPRLYIDQWTHEQDIRAALALPGPVNNDFLEWLGQISARTMISRAAKRAPGPLRITRPSGEIGDVEGADVWARLEVDDYTLARVLVGRRSIAQLRALNWETIGAEPDDWFDSLVIFGPAEDDIADVCHSNQ